MRYRAHDPKIDIHLHYTKTLKRDNVYKLCLWHLPEQNLPSIKLNTLSKAEI